MVLKENAKEKTKTSLDHLKLFKDSYASYTSYRSKVRAVRKVRISRSLFASATSLPLLPMRPLPRQCAHSSTHPFLIQRPSFCPRFYRRRSVVSGGRIPVRILQPGRN